MFSGVENDASRTDSGVNLLNLVAFRPASGFLLVTTGEGSLLLEDADLISSVLDEEALWRTLKKIRFCSGIYWKNLKLEQGRKETPPPPPGNCFKPFYHFFLIK